MVESSSDRRWPGLIEIAFSIGLIGCLLGCIVYSVGQPNYQYWWPKTVPGAAEFDSGSVLMADGDLKGAIEAFGKARDKNHHHVLAVFYQAKAHQKLGESVSAIDGFAEALRLDMEIAKMKRDQRETLSPVPWVMHWPTRISAERRC